jgi:hypothetical protein
VACSTLLSRGVAHGRHAGVLETRTERAPLAPPGAPAQRVGSTESLSDGFAYRYPPGPLPAYLARIHPLGDDTVPNTKDKAIALGESVREDLKGFRDELRGLADEIRVRVHLGSMDLKDSWRDMEPKVHEFEARLEKAGAEIGKEFKEVGNEVKQATKDLEVAGGKLKQDLLKLRERLAKH